MNNVLNPFSINGLVKVYKGKGRTVSYEKKSQYLSYMLTDDMTIQHEYAPLESIPDNYEKYVVSLDDLQLPSRGGIHHIRAWELNDKL